MKRRACLIGLSVLLGADLLAQPVFRGSEIFPPEEFAARRARVVRAIGDGVAIVLGTTEPAGEMPFRQNSQFFYLTGVAEPRASVDHRRSDEEDHCLSAAADGEAGHEPRRAGPGARPGDGRGDWRRCRAARAPTSRRRSRRLRRTIARSTRRLRPKCSAASRRAIRRNCGRRTQQDPWDGRDSREATFIATAQGGRAAVGDRESRSDSERTARREEPARDRGDS